MRQLRSSALTSELEKGEILLEAASSLISARTETEEMKLVA